MTGWRTAILWLMPYLYPTDAAAYGAGEQRLSVEQLGELLPKGRAVLLALRGAGWQLTHVAIDDLATSDASDRHVLDVSINFNKDFVSADTNAVIADAQACGLTPGWGNVEVGWTDDREDTDEDSDENAIWDMTGTRVRLAARLYRARSAPPRGSAPPASSSLKGQRLGLWPAVH